MKEKIKKLLSWLFSESILKKTIYILIITILVLFIFNGFKIGSGYIPKRDKIYYDSSLSPILLPSGLPSLKVIK